MTSSSSPITSSSFFHVAAVPPAPPSRPRRRPFFTVLLPLGAVLLALYERSGSDVVQGRATAALELLGQILPPGTEVLADVEGEVSELALQLEGYAEELAGRAEWTQLHEQVLYLLSDLRDAGAWSRAVA